MEPDAGYYRRVWRMALSEIPKTWSAHRSWFTICPIGFGAVVLVIQVVRHAKALSDLVWALASGLGLAALLWIGSFVIELYKAPIKIDSQQQESLATLQSKVGSTKVASWEPGFEKEIRAQLKLTIPEVRRLLHHLIVYGPKLESDLLLRFGDGIIRLAEEEYFISHYQGKIDVLDRFRPILSKVIYEYTDEP